MSQKTDWYNWIVHVFGRKPVSVVQTENERLARAVRWEVLPVDFGPDWFVVRRKRQSEETVLNERRRYDRR